MHTALGAQPEPGSAGRGLQGSPASGMPVSSATHRLSTQAPRAQRSRHASPIDGKGMHTLSTHSEPAAQTSGATQVSPAIAVRAHLRPLLPKTQSSGATQSVWFTHDPP